MKSIVVFFKQPNFSDEPLDEAVYVEGYTELAKAVTAKGARFVIARGQYTYLGGTTFQGGWMFLDGVFQRYDGRLKADLIYNKDNTFIATPDANIINRRGLEDICIDKMVTYRHFPELFPLSVQAKSRQEYLQALGRITSDMIVVKPLTGFGGEGVHIIPRQEALQLEPEFPLLVQQFIDTSGGIPGIVDGIHDFRIIVMNGRVLSTTVRTPASGKLLSNVSQGGTMQTVLPADRPADALAFVEKIDPSLEKFGSRMYTIDLGRDISGQWYLIELNDQPGLQTREEAGGGEHADRYYGEFAEFLIASASVPALAS